MESGNAAGRAIKSRGPRCRTGCVTCRIRRIKCDETRPVCFRCQSTGRKCDGYSSNIANGYARRHLKRRPGYSDPTRTVHPDPDGYSGPSFHSNLNAVSNPLRANPCLKISSSEQRSLHYFRHHTAPCLSGYFTSASSSSFWSSTLLQAIYSEPSVQQAALALSTVHEALEHNGDLRPENTDNVKRMRSALLYYNKAVSQTLKVLSTSSSQGSDSNVTLMSCLLFICHELLQDNYNMGSNHFLGGLHLAVSISPLSIDKDIGSLFTQLLIQTLFFGIDRFQPELLPLGNDKPCEITRFSCLADAKETLDSLFMKLYILKLDLRCHSPGDFIQSHKSISALTSSWEKMLQDLLIMNSSNFTTADLTTFKLLQLHHTCLKIMLDEVGPNANSTAHPKVSSLAGCYQNLLTLASSLLQSPTTFNSQQNPRPPAPLLPRFTFSLGLIAPLFYTAIRCRSAVLRREAFALLGHPCIPYREGIWGSTVAAAVAGRILRVELGTDDEPATAGGKAEAKTQHEMALGDLSMCWLGMYGPTPRVEPGIYEEGRETGTSYSRIAGEDQWDVETPTFDDRVLRLRIRNRREVVAF